MVFRKKRKRKAVSKKRKRRVIARRKTNPIRKKRRVYTMAKRRRRRRKHNPGNPSMYKRHRVHHRRRKRNPSGNDIMNIFVNGAIGTAGAVAAKTLVELVTKAAAGATGGTTSPVMKNIISLIVAGGAGFLAGKFIKDKSKAEALQTGMFVYVGLEMAKQFLGFSGADQTQAMLSQMGLNGATESQMLLGVDPLGLSGYGAMESELGEYDMADLS